MNSLDSKITQYLYAINKLQLFITSLKRLSARENVKDLPLCQYLVLLTGNVFSINEALFNPRLEIVSQFKLFKNTPITVLSVVSHVPYDTQDLQITSLAELPTAERANKVIKLLESLCFNCLQAYQKRLQQAKIERTPSDPDFFTKLDEIIKKEIFDEKLDLDLDLTDSKVLLNLPLNQNLLNNEDFIEATLVDMDIKMLFAVNSSLLATVEKLKDQISKYLAVKKLALPEKYLASIADGPDSSLESSQDFTMHKLCALAIRLNELYIIFRKIGRKVYFSNYDHLYDSKFLFQTKNQNYFKMHLLKDIDEVFNSTRKNGTLIATLTRFFRQGAYHEPNVKNVNDFINFINQGQMMLSSCLSKVDEFSINWLVGELRFRKVYGLPKKILTDLYTQQTEAEASAKSVASPGGRPLNKTTPSSSESGTLGDISADLASFRVSSSRTSSISSQTSLPSITTPSKPLVRRTTANRNSMLVSPSPTSKGNAANGSFSESPIRNGYSSPSRPQSMIFMNTNSSLSSLPLQKPTLQQKLLAAEGSSNSPPVSDSNPTMAGRRRANSQPIKPLENLLAPPAGLASPSAAASGAASALRNNMARSPSGSIKRSASVSRSSPVPKQLISVQEEIVPPGPPQLTVNQRLQQHLKQQAKQGTLMIQQKETLSSVVFDPSCPSSVNLRPPPKPQPQPTEKVVLPPPAPAPIKNVFQGVPSASSAPKTRDQVTRLNTRRNSVNQPIPPPISGAVSSGPSATSSLSTLSDSGSTATNTDINSPADSETFKKVRFTGVPEYSEAEDAPTSYSSRILKNFAVFKTPIPTSKPTFKRKDQMLKKEESISFKSQLHSPIPPENVNGFQIPSASANPISTNRLSKLKNKIIQ